MTQFQENSERYPQTSSLQHCRLPDINSLLFIQPSNSHTQSWPNRSQQIHSKLQKYKISPNHILNPINPPCFTKLAMIAFLVRLLRLHMTSHELFKALCILIALASNSLKAWNVQGMPATFLRLLFETCGQIICTKESYVNLSSESLSEWFSILHASQMQKAAKNLSFCFLFASRGIWCLRRSFLHVFKFKISLLVEIFVNHRRKSFYSFFPKLRNTPKDN